MATTSGIGFRWLDILEKEFDKACVELDTSMSLMETDEPEWTFATRQKIATLSSCFAQLTHKALTVFQNSTKLEAELVDMRAELVQARAAAIGIGQEDGDAPGNVYEACLARAEAAQLAKENAALRETVLALHSELFGARLATKYLDKELAGRIQQLQLLGRDMRADLRDSLWAQVEAEILLQRHKTLVRVCRGAAGAAGGAAPAGGARARPRTVRVRRSKHLGLGISVTGGREHGVPILISELEVGGPAALTGQLYVGDAILAINDVDLTQACHKEAVLALQSVKGDCALCVQFIANDESDRLSEDNYRFPLYPEDGVVIGGEQDGSGATPTAPRTPDYNNRPPSAADSDCGSIAEYHPPLLEYSSLTNKLSILDMDDDSIKIEAPPPPPAPPKGYQHVPAKESSNESAHSTPVHQPRAIKKKRVKPVDWRSKGTYRAVDDHPSSDDLTDVPVNGKTNSDKATETSPTNERAASPPQTVPIRELIQIEDPPVVPVLPPPKEVPIPRTNSKLTLPSKVNGFEQRPAKSRGFRIGTAKRVSDTPALTNGNISNGDTVRVPTALVSGDGDPDFGTPV